MALSIAEIQRAKDDAQLFGLLSSALGELFPPDLQTDREQFLAALTEAPRGLRAMAGIYDLDVSMSLDDLAWHFGNHNDERFLDETAASLKELEVIDAADIFGSAWDTVRPFLPEIRGRDWGAKEFTEYLAKTGIQSRIDPLNKRMWTICSQAGPRGLMQYWLSYARKYPERCVTSQ